jgi:hypothetical protein
MSMTLPSTVKVPLPPLPRGHRQRDYYEGSGGAWPRQRSEGLHAAVSSGVEKFSAPILHGWLNSCGRNGSGFEQANAPF